MRTGLILATATALALAGCGGGGGANNAATGDLNMALGGDEITPLPEDENGLASASTLGAPAGPRAATAADYVRIALASDLFEIESSRLALERARNPAVREFAQMLITDHTRSTEALGAAAQAAEPSVAMTQPALDPQQRQIVEGLRTAGEGAFDQLYLQGQVQAHQQTLAALQDYARTGTVPSLRQHASSTAAPVEQHLTRARQLAAQPQ